MNRFEANRVLAAARALSAALPADQVGARSRKAGEFYLSRTRQGQGHFLLVGRADRLPSYEEATTIAAAVGVPEDLEPKPKQCWMTVSDLPARKVLAVEYSWR